MKYHFKQSVSLDGKDYACGPREVSESAEKHPHFAHYVKAGYIEEVKKEVLANPPVTAKEVTKKVLDKALELAKKAEAPKVESEEAPDFSSGKKKKK